MADLLAMLKSKARLSLKKVRAGLPMCHEEDSRGACQASGRRYDPFRRTKARRHPDR